MWIGSSSIRTERTPVPVQPVRVCRSHQKLSKCFIFLSLQLRKENQIVSSGMYTDGLTCTEVSCGQTIYDECDGCKLAYCRDCISGFSFSPLKADLGTGTAISEVSFDSPRPSSLFEAGTLALTSSSTELTLHREPVIVQRAKLKRCFVEKKPSERETVKSYYINKADQRYDANIIKLSTVSMTGHASWVW